jgi:hypothetical protein
VYEASTTSKSGKVISVTVESTVVGGWTANALSWSRDAANVVPASSLFVIDKTESKGENSGVDITVGVAITNGDTAAATAAANAFKTELDAYYGVETVTVKGEIEYEAATAVSSAT